MASALHSELAAILEGAAVFPLDDRGFLRVTGGDATRWLNGMVTNNIAALAPGEGNYNFLLNAQGRIQGDCTVYREPDGEQPAFLLVTDELQLEAIRQHLDHFIIMDDVELKPLVDRAALLLIGPDSQKLLAATDITTEGLDFGELAQITWHSSHFDLVRIQNPLVLSYEIWADIDAMPAISEALSIAGASLVSPQALEALRVLEARPKFGQDIRDKDLPQETAQNHALNFNKGCYLGQEIVERIHSRGQVHRSFAAFTLTPEGAEDGLPALPAGLQANGKAAGTLTSAAVVPMGDGKRVMGLGYVRREHENEALSYPGGIARVRKASKEMVS